MRVNTQQGERIALANSETVPIGTTCEFKVTLLRESLVDFVKECLKYGALKGMCQWRNSGKGRFDSTVTE
jgi:hypothetical protein